MSFKTYWLDLPFSRSQRLFASLCILQLRLYNNYFTTDLPAAGKGAQRKRFDRFVLKSVFATYWLDLALSRSKKGSSLRSECC
jgi:hypothetical protein